MGEWRKSSFSGSNTDCVEVAWHKSSFSSVNTNCVEVAWRKSSFSDDNTNCVEVAAGVERVGVRDSKNSAPSLVFTDGGWRRFVISLR